MVLRDKIKEHGSLFLYTWIEFHPIKGLIDLSYTALKRVIFLVTKKFRASKLISKLLYLIYGFLVSGMEIFFLCSLIDIQPLIIIVVKNIKSIGIIYNHIKQLMTLVACRNRLLHDSSADHLHKLPQFSYLLLTNSIVHSISFNQILLQNPICPTAKLNTTLALYTIANRDYHVKIVICYAACNLSITFRLNCRKFCDS